MNISANSQKPDSPKIYRIKANLTIIKLLHASIRPCFSVICWPLEISFASIMPPQREFQAEKYLAVVHCKGGKAVRKSKLSVPLCYASQLEQQTTPTTSSFKTSSSGEYPAGWSTPFTCVRILWTLRKTRQRFLFNDMERSSGGFY